MKIEKSMTDALVKEFRAESKKPKSGFGSCSCCKHKVHEKEKKPQEQAAPTPFEMMRPQGLTTAEITTTAPVKVTEVEEVFEKMVSSMQMLVKNGDTKTTFFLNSSHPVFSDTEITIYEFRTAPKEFNIQLKGSPEAVGVFEKHLPELINAFNAESRPFVIKRLDIHQNLKRSSAKKVHGLPEEELARNDDSALSLD